MENDYKTVPSEVSEFSEMAEKWASQINSFANNIKQYGSVSDKAWNKVKIIDSICIYTRSVIQQYCNNFDNSNISVGYISFSRCFLVLKTECRSVYCSSDVTEPYTVGIGISRFLFFVAGSK